MHHATPSVKYVNDLYCSVLKINRRFSNVTHSWFFISGFIFKQSDLQSFQIWFVRLIVSSPVTFFILIWMLLWDDLCLEKTKRQERVCENTKQQFVDEFLSIFWYLNRWTLLWRFLLSFQIFVLLFLLLLVGSYTLIERFRRRDREDLYSTDDDELKVYRISLLFCIFSFAVALGSSFLLPLSIISNEVLLLYPNSYYVQWLNSSLIQGLWNHVFLFSNLAIFVLLPFAYLFSESSGFLGHKKGVVPRLYETSVVFVLLIFVVIGLIYVLLAVLYPERSSFLSMLSKFTLWFINKI